MRWGKRILSNCNIANSSRSSSNVSSCQGNVLTREVTENGTSPAFCRKMTKSSNVRLCVFLIVGVHFYSLDKRKQFSFLCCTIIVRNPRKQTVQTIPTRYSRPKYFLAGKCGVRANIRNLSHSLSLIKRQCNFADVSLIGMEILV